MRSKHKKLPDDIVNHWPEIFADIDFGVIPINYLNAVRVSFHDGKIWNIDIGESATKDDPEEIEKNLLKLLFLAILLLLFLKFLILLQQLNIDLQGLVQYIIWRKI